MGGGEGMKQGRRPTKKQKIAIAQVGLNYSNWLVTKNLPDTLHIAHRETGRERRIPV